VSTESNLPDPSGDIRTYRGRTLGEILERIRFELGPDAVIVREREGLIGGVGGFFAHRFIELDARRGNGQSIGIHDNEPGDDLPPAAQRDWSTPPARRFETAAFMERLREATAVLREASLADAAATRMAAAQPEPVNPASGPRGAAGRDPGAETKRKGKAETKAKDKGKGNDKAKDKRKHKAKVKTKALLEDQPVPHASSGWAAEPAPISQGTPHIANERLFERLHRFLPDIVVAALLLVVLGPRHQRSSQRASRQARCPLCGRRYGPAAPGRYGTPPPGRLSGRRTRRCEFPCRCH